MKSVSIGFVCLCGVNGQIRWVPKCIKESMSTFVNQPENHGTHETKSV